MTALNQVTRYHLVIDAISNARRIPAGAGELLAWCEEKLTENSRYIVQHLEDLPEIRNWQLPKP
jgi:xylulose-5-phosphate/fructose-6-phosphate phosphoketolase